MSVLVTETSAWQVPIPAALSVSSRCDSPITTLRPSRLAIGSPAALWLLSTHTTPTPRSCSWPTIFVPTLPRPTTIT